MIQITPDCCSIRYRKDVWVDWREMSVPALRLLRMIDDNIGHFQFTALIFGETFSSRFCALYLIHKCATYNKSEFEAALNAIKRKFDIDDYINNLQTTEEAKDVISEKMSTKWWPQFDKVSMVASVFQTNKTRAENPADHKDEAKQVKRVLVQKLNIRSDEFVMFHLHSFLKMQQCTQRGNYIVWHPQSLILLILSPVTIKIKMVRQQIWKLGKNFEELTSLELHSALLNFWTFSLRFCALYLIHKCATYNKSEFEAALNAIKRKFDIDDYINNLQTTEEAKDVISGKMSTRWWPQFDKVSMVASVFQTNQTRAENPADHKDETKQVKRVLVQKLNKRSDEFVMFHLYSFLKMQQCTQRGNYIVWHPQSLILLIFCLLWQLK